MSNIIPFPIKWVSIEPLSAIDLIKTIGKEADIYSELCQVLTANEYARLIYPHTSRGKLDRSKKAPQAFNPDF